MSKTTAVCEHTKERILLYDGCYVGNCKTGEWMFCSNKDADALGQYSIRVTELSERPEALLDWMAHLNEKAWFDPKKFFTFFKRFRKENSLYGG